MTQTTLVIPYAHMVDKLFRADTLPMMYIHCAFGVVGEAIELSQAIGKADILEELGDFAFYAQKLMLLEGKRFEDYVTTERDLGSTLVWEAFGVMDVIKKFAVYGGELDEEKLHYYLPRMMAVFFSYLRIYGWTLDDVQVANQKKLLTGEKARYKLGFFTTEQALARADKETT